MKKCKLIFREILSQEKNKRTSGSILILTIGFSIYFVVFVRKHQASAIFSN